MAIQTIEQQRAKYALEKIQKISPEDHEEWLSRATEIPAMIQMNGLGQTMAFYRSKGDIHNKMYDLVSVWLCEKMKVFQNQKDLMMGIVSADMSTYRMAQAESQALLIWVKKFSKAYCRKKEV